MFHGKYGCGSKIGTQNGTLVSGNMDQNLWSPRGLILTHTHTGSLSDIAFSKPKRGQGRVSGRLL